MDQDVDVEGDVRGFLAEEMEMRTHQKRVSSGGVTTTTMPR